MTPRRLAILFLLCGAAAASQSDRESPGYAAYRRANSLFVAKKFPESLASVEEALRLDPNLVPALTLHAKMAMSQNRFDLARQNLEHAISVDPASSYARFLYGLNFYLANDLKLALPQFEKAGQMDPADPRSALYLGLTYESLGRTAEALALYEKAVHLEELAKAPQPETYLTGSRLLLALGRLDDSGIWIRKALKLQPDSRETLFELGRLLLKKGDAAQASRVGEEALRLPGANPTDIQIHYLLIRSYAGTNPAEAARHAEVVRSLERR